VPGIRKTKGFTLIELMIVLAIAGIIASVALPAYTAYAIESRRLDGQVALRVAAQVMERCRTQTFTYKDCEDNVNTTSPDGYYDITYLDADITATKYKLTAKPVTTKSQANDAECTTLSLEQDGTTTATGSATTTCW